MKTYLIIFLLGFIIACSGSKDKKTEEHTAHTEHSDDAKQKPKSKSPQQMAMSDVGDNHIHIEYHSPSKRGRQIFGGLVAYNEVWVTGAHYATSITFSKDVEIGNNRISAGKYALFTIPGEEEWIVIINKNWDQHLADEYNKFEDVVRITATPKKLDTAVESLTYEVTEKVKNIGVITITWDDIQIAFEVKNL